VTPAKKATAVAFMVSSLAALCHESRAQGIVAPGAGPILRSFGGTAIAAPLDAVGALYWNPATLSFLDKRIDIGAEGFLKSQHVESTIPANLLGPGNPPTSVTGKTKSSDGFQLAPAVAAVFRFPGNRWGNLTLSGGIIPYSGGGSNYPADPNNPSLAGLGGWYNNFIIITFPMAASYKFSKRLSLGLALDPATVTWQWSRAIFAHPEMATINNVRVTQYVPAFATSPTYGVGVHAGGYYHFDSGLGLGLMIKSPIFFQTIDYTTTTLLGQPRTVSVKLDTPPFIGVGVSYDSVSKWLFALDLKYAFYQHNTGYYGQQDFFQADGTINGLGYDNALAVTTGVQYKPNDKLSARLGYKYSTRVVPNDPTFELTSSSLRHAVGGGISYDVTKAIGLHAAYVLSWAIPIAGEMTSPLNNQTIPGSRVRLTLVEYAPSIGLSVKY
jgi:long-chain fatty acid transport protein